MELVPVKNLTEICMIIGWQHIAMHEFDVITYKCNRQNHQVVAND